MSIQHISGPEPVPVKPEEHLVATLQGRADDETEILRFHDGEQ